MTQLYVVGHVPPFVITILYDLNLPLILTLDIETAAVHMI